MRKNNVWKQALALALSAAMVLGNISPVSAAAGDAGADAAKPAAVSDGDGNKPSVPSKTDPVEFKADGQIVSAGEGYEESGVKFSLKDVEIVDDPVEGGAHGKVFKFKTGQQDINGTEKTTGIGFLTSEKGILEGYDFTKGITFSFDICPDAQTLDWNYLFVVGIYDAAKRDTLTGTTGFISAFDSQKRKNDPTVTVEPGTWQANYPGSGWIAENKGDYEWDYFNKEENAHKWYNMKYSYTPDGLTIAVNGTPVISYPDAKGYVADILTKLSGEEVQLRLGKGVLTTLEGYQGCMDNIKLEPIAADHVHTFAPGSTEKRVEATCTESGYIDKGICTGCENAIKETIPALGHQFTGEVVPAKAATCAEAGNIEHYVCQRVVDEENETTCGAYGVKGEDGKITEVTDVSISKLTADWGETEITKAKADQENGSKVTKCKTCNGTASKHTRTETIYKAEIALKETSCTYTGQEIKPEVTVTADEEPLDKENYDVAYSNNTNAGTATVTITFKGDLYEGTATRTFTITPAGSNPPVASLTLDKTSVTLYTGNAKKSDTVKAAVTGTSQTVTWKSDNDKIATVDGNGKITAVKAGTTNVTATANGKTQIVKVTVKNPTITLKSGKKKFTKKTLNVKRKKKTTLTVSVNPAKSGFALKMTPKEKKKIKKIATVSLNKKNGKLTIKGKKKGSFTLKITSGNATKTLKVKVK